MRIVYKFPLVHRQSIELPHAFTPRHVGMQLDQAMAWIEVDPGLLRRFMTVLQLGTGERIPYTAATYLGTVISDGGEHVWHYYVIDNADLVKAEIKR